MMHSSRRRITISFIMLGVLALGLIVWLLRPAQAAPIRANLSVAEAVNTQDVGFKRVTEPRQFSFPADHGPHPDYATEWWYYTGNLDSADGRHFGFQLTFFRRGLTPDPINRDSAWATSNIYMAHFALTDVSGGKFYAFDRFSRDGAALAGATGTPFHVWVENWQASAAPDGGMRLQASQAPVAFDLVARSTKAPVLQGDNGLSQKSADPGNASYYYSLTRMATDGTITINGQPFTVTGLTWMDREWSTSALAPNQMGWDWFALQLGDGYELMYYQMRLRDGGIEPLSSGVLVSPDGSATRIARDDLRLDVLNHWRSPTTGTTYPSGWRVQIPKLRLDLSIEPYLPDQELNLAVHYWEGAVNVGGSHDGRQVGGSGYIEMTGYGEGEQDAVTGRPPR